MPRLVDGESFKKRLVGQHLAGADDDGREWLFDDLDRQLRFLVNEAIEVAQESAPTAYGNAAIVDVRGQLRRNLIQRLAHDLDDRLERVRRGRGGFGRRGCARG